MQRMIGAALVLVLMATGCNARWAPSGATTAPPAASVPNAAATTAEVDRLRLANADLQARLTKAEADLTAAQEEVRWLHLGLAKSPGRDTARSAIEAYASALVGRNGALARIYLSQAMRAQTGMPAHGIGVSNPHLTRYVIVSATKEAATRYRFRVRFYTEYTGSPEAAGDLETYVVEVQKDDTGNEAWLITDIQR